ncbi:MAG TPA: tetratricopeptide repeat protein [Dongiaceae bacterium]
MAEVLQFGTARTRQAGLAAWRNGDLKRAYEILLPIAETADDSECHFIVGQVLAMGAADLPADRSAAIGWLDFASRGQHEAARAPLKEMLSRSSETEIAEGKRRSFAHQQKLINHQNGKPDAASPEVTAGLSEMAAAEAEDLGERLLNGVNVPVDYAAAFRCFAQAAASGHPKAQFNAGVSLYAGKGVLRDLAAAFGWFQASAEQGYGAAATMAGVMLVKGEGIGQDRERGLAYLQKASDLGDAQGRSALAALRSGATLA